MNGYPAQEPRDKTSNLNGDLTIKRAPQGKRQAKINDNIDAKEVRLIAADGTGGWNHALAEALRKAELEELDPLQITDSDPIICRIMDYGKKIFEEEKKAAAKKKQKQVQVKNQSFVQGRKRRLSGKTAHLIRFLEEGDKGPK